MIDIEALNYRQEVDTGLILRASDEVATYIRDFTQNQNDRTLLELIPLNIDKRLYGLKLGTNKNGYLYYCTLCDLPTISEAHKTLDMKTFYKSCDISQIMYVHPNKIDQTKVDLVDFIKKNKFDFDPIRDDPEFLDLLYNRSAYKKQNRNFTLKTNTNSNSFRIPSFIVDNDSDPTYDYVMRDGLTPATKNVKNVRYKKEVKEDPEEISKVETVLKDIIEYRVSRFPDENEDYVAHVTEELLYFDDNGELIRTEGLPEYEYERGMSNDDISYNDEMSRY